MGRERDPEASYPDATNFMERAMESENGAMIDFRELVDQHTDPEKAAFNFQMQCYTIRKRQRERSRKIYSEEHPNYDTSQFDELSFKLQGPKKTGKGPILIAVKNRDLLRDYSIKDPVTGEEL